MLSSWRGKKDAMNRGASIYAEISGWSGGYYLNRNDEALTGIMVDAIKKGKINSDLIEYIYSGAIGSSNDYLEARSIKTLFNKSRYPLIGSLRPNVGEAFVATTIFQIISASLIVERGVIPSSIKLSTTHPEWQGLSIPREVVRSTIKAVMINSIGLEGSFASLVIKKLEM